MHRLSKGLPRLLGGVGVLAAAFGLYLSTLAPTVLYYDSGTLQAKAAVLGIGHPTGYPAFILLGKLFTYLPFGDVAYRVNLSSAVYGSLAVLMVYLVGLRLTGGRAVIPAALGALAFAATPLLWSLSVVTEVYTLNALLVAATLYAFLLWRDTRRDSHLVLAGLLTGLSMTAHMTSGLLIPAGLLFVALVDRRTLGRPKLLVRGAGAIALGLSPYLYLPLRAAMDPPMNYGNASTLEGFLFLVSGGNFKGQMLAYGPSALPGRLGMYASDLLQQFPTLLLGAAVLGALVLALRDRQATALLGLFLAAYLAYTLEYSISDIQTYFIPTHLILALFIAVGLGYLFEMLGELPGPTGVYSGALALIVVAMIGLFVYQNYPKLDQSNNYAARHSIEEVVENTESGATVLSGRQLAALQYMQTVEGRRTDLELVMINGENLPGRARATAGEGPSYLLTSPGSSPDIEGVEASRAGEGLYRLRPSGG